MKYLKNVQIFENFNLALMSRYQDSLVLFGIVSSFCVEPLPEAQQDTMQNLCVRAVLWHCNYLFVLYQKIILPPPINFHLPRFIFTFPDWYFHILSREKYFFPGWRAILLHFFIHFPGYIGARMVTAFAQKELSAWFFCFIH